MSDTSEPDYTITIIERDGFSIVCEGGVQISIPILDREEAERWAEQHQRFYQPRCCVCGSATTRPNDPWEAYSVSSQSGVDWMHNNCMEKFHSWDHPPGWQPIPPMEVLDAAWAKKQRGNEDQ